MEIITLGTSSGTPTKSRNVTAAAVCHTGSKSWALIDCGEGTQHQLLHTPLALNHLSTILITHLHGDHTYGLPGLLASASMAGRTAPVTLVAPANIKPWLKASQRMAVTHLTFPIEFIEVESLKLPIELKEFKLSCHPLSHRIPSYAYSLTEIHIENRLNTHKLAQKGIPTGPIWGQLQNGIDVKLPTGEMIKSEDYLLPARKPRKIIVGGDNDSPELLKKAVADADLLIHESTYTDAIAEKVGKGPQHSSAKKVAQFAEKSNLNNLILTHFSARYQDNANAENTISEIEQEAKKYFSGHLFLANDFDHFKLEKNGQLKLLHNFKKPLE